jgi:general secretion pathway protein I
MSKSPTRDSFDRKSSAGGFTLLEVMVALFVVAIALAALVAAVGKQSQIAERVRAKTYADMVAANVLAEVKLREKWPEPGTRSGAETIAGQSFRWRAQVQSTQAEQLRRIDVQVSRSVSASAQQEPLVTRTAFIGRL